MKNAALQFPGMVESRHRWFSFARIAAITRNTLTELVRLKVFYFLLIFALLLIGNSIFMARLTFQQEFQMLKDVALGAMSIFTSLLAIVATARLLPQDIEDRTLYTILAKPVPRFEYLAGKLAGMLLLLAISILVMSAMFVAVLYLREQVLLSQTLRQMSGRPTEQIREVVRSVEASAFNADLLPGIIIIYLKSCLLAALTLFGNPASNQGSTRWARLAITAGSTSPAFGSASSNAVRVMLTHHSLLARVAVT